MKKIILIGMAVVSAVLMFAAGVFAGDISTPSAKGPQWDSWNPRGNMDVGDPMFKVAGSKTMDLYYGFRGAVVFDRGTNKWERARMVTITRKKVEGYVNQVNDNFVLAAGLHDIAVYDFSKHKWVVLERTTPDDSTAMLPKNFIVTPQFVQVRQLNGPFWKYTSASGWQRQ
jgi:hypothetical protein